MSYITDGTVQPAQRAKSSRDLKAQARSNSARPSPLKQELGGAFAGAGRVADTPPTHPKVQNISIRGLAGPAVVIGSNFAPGTTAADIQSAMEPVGGQIQSCRVITARPTVIAEVVFNDRAGAEAVIETFNNQKADGRLLHIYLKTGPGGQNLVPPRTDFEQALPPARLQSPAQHDLFDSHDRYDRVPRDGPRLEAGYQDGRYGFEEAKQEPDGDVDMDEQAVARVDDGPNDRQYNDDRRDSRYDGRREDRSYRQPNRGEFDKRYGMGSRDNRMYSDRGSYRGRGFR